MELGRDGGHRLQGVVGAGNGEGVIMLLEHVAITVGNLETAVRFYTEKLDFSILRQGRGVAYLNLGDGLLELVEGKGREDVRMPTSPEGWWQRFYSGRGPSELGVRVDNLDVIVAKLRDRGTHPVIPPFEYRPEIDYIAETDCDKLSRAARPRTDAPWRIALYADPDGTLIELIER